MTEVATERLRPCRASTIGCCTVILISSKLRSVHQVELLGEVGNGQTTVEANLNLTCCSTLGGDDNNAITTLSTVDSGERGILEHVNRSNIRWRNIVDVVLLEAIDDEQRVVGLCHRRSTTHADVDICARLSIRGCHLHTGDLTLQCLCCGCHRHGCQLGTRDRTYRSCQIFTCLTGVTEDNDLIETIALLLKDDALVFAGTYHLLHHADIADLGFLTLSELQREVSIKVCNCCILRVALLYDSCTDDRFILRVVDCATRDVLR